jgi:polyisoprenoid-binding protein YceI
MTTLVDSNTAPAVQTWSVWQIDPRHGLAEFSARHMMLSRVRGHFTGVSGTIIDAADEPTYSSVKAEIDVTTLTTGDPQRDAHLLSPDFLDVTNHPTIAFESRRVSGSRQHFKVTGDLTIRGQTREVVLDVTFNGVGTNPLGQVMAGFSAETRINRKDFGLNWNVALEAGGFLVGDDVKIEIELEAFRQEPAAEVAS